MPAVYPMSVKSFTPKTDNLDIIWAAHVNDLQNEVSAVEATVGKNPHVFAGISFPSGKDAILRVPAPVPGIGAATTYKGVGDRLDQVQKQVAWLTARMNAVPTETDWKPPAAVIIAPGMRVPAGEGSWAAFRWGSADFDPTGMFQGGTSIYCPVTGFWDVSVSTWADSTVRRRGDLHFVHTRLIRGYDEIAGQDSMIETMTWIKHRINMSWQGRWNAGIPMRVDVSQHGAADTTVNANCVISLSYVRDLSK
ncbi:hypothetical protein ABZ543_12915 [Streptomyces roseifaciens]